MVSINVSRISSVIPNALYELHVDRVAPIWHYFSHGTMMIKVVAREGEMEGGPTSLLTSILFDVVFKI